MISDELENEKLKARLRHLEGLRRELETSSYRNFENIATIILNRLDEARLKPLNHSPVFTGSTNTSK